MGRRNKYTCNECDMKCTWAIYWWRAILNIPCPKTIEERACGIYTGEPLSMGCELVEHRIEFTHGCTRLCSRHCLTNHITVDELDIKCPLGYRGAVMKRLVKPKVV